MRIPNLVLAVGGILLFTATGCSKDEQLTEGLTVKHRPGLMSRFSGDLLTMSFEVDETTVARFEGTDISSLNALFGHPHREVYRTELVLAADGSSKITTDVLLTNPFEMPDEMLVPEKDRVMKSILEGTTLTLYNGHGDQIGEETAAEALDLSDLAEAVSSGEFDPESLVNQTIVQQTSLAFATSLDSLISLYSPSAQQEPNARFVSLQIPAANLPGLGSEVHLVNISIDRQLRRINATSSVDDSGVELSSTVFVYEGEETANSGILKQMLHRNRVPMPDGVIAHFETTSNFSNLSFTY